jgi:hypothetical protein
MRLIVCLFLGILVILGGGNHAGAVPPVDQVEIINQPIAVIGVVEVTNEPLSVEITNEPVAVEVVNPPPASPPVRWQLVGFTTATYTGAMGGHFGVTRKCQLEFPNSRMCSLEEVAITTTIPDGLNGVAWAHPQPPTLTTVLTSSGISTGRDTCGFWRNVGSGGQIVDADGVTAQWATCTESYPIACCALVPY